MRKTPDLSARMERFREVLRVNLRFANTDFVGAARDFYLHFHEVKIDTGLCTEDSLLNPKTRDHFYRPEAFWKVFVERPELIDDELFPSIYTELCKTVRVSKLENNFLARRFGDVLTERLYEQADMKLMRRDGNKHWKAAIALNTGRLEVPKFMRELEVDVLGRS
jgi:hypothetical protein